MHAPRSAVSLSVAAAVLLAVSAETCSAGAAEDAGVRTGTAWSTVEATGAASMCRIAGFNERIDTSRLTLQLIRLIHGDRSTATDPTGRTRDAVLSYLSAIDALARLTASMPTPALQGGVPTPARLREMRPAMAVLGLGFAARSPEPWHDLPHYPAGLRHALSDAGLSLDNLAARLNRGETVPLVLARTPLPLPLTPRVWRDAILHGNVPDGSLFAAIVSDRTTALLYYGLASLDDETLEFLAGRPGLLSSMKEHPGAFAATVRSIHVRGARVIVPGGAAEEPLWTSLVGARPDQPERFLAALLHQSGGRLPYFYDAVTHLDADRQRLLLGLAPGVPGQAAVRFRQLYQSFTAALLTWSIETHPFTRPVGDGLGLFAELSVEPGGQMSPPNSMTLWRCVFNELPAADQAPTADETADAAAIAHLVLAPQSGFARRQRMRTVWFAQRAFARTTTREAPAVCAVLRAYPQFEALALVLARTGVDDPNVYERAMTRASALSALRPPVRTTAFSQFQGALALIDRLAVQETLEARDAWRLVESLVAVPISDDGYHGAIAGWLRDRLIPALRARLPPSTATSGEDLLLEALAGVAPVVAAPRWTIDWEGERYGIDPAASELARLLRVRRKQAGARVDRPLALDGLASALGQSHVPPPEAGRLAGEVVALLKSAPFAPDADDDGGAETHRDKLSETAERFAASPESDARRLALADRVARMSDEMLGRALRSLAYAAAIGSPDSNLFLGSDVALDHDFGAADSEWSIAVEQAGAGIAWHLRGSLLALDVPLARYSLRRISSDLPSGAPRLDPADVQGLAHSAVLRQPWSITDAARDKLVALVAQGRQDASAATSISARAALFDLANVSEWRRNELAWLTARGEVRLEDAFTLTELLWVGARRAGVLPPDSWGMSSAPLSGCLCLRFLGPGAVETVGAEPGMGRLSSYLADPILRLAQLTAEMRLPAALIPSLLPAVTADVLDAAWPADALDWVDVANAARGITRERLEDQIAALTVAGGPLVPAAGAHAPGSEHAQALHLWRSGDRRRDARPGA